MYSPASGFSWEMSFSAIGMKPPGLASAAPAPTTAIAGEEASPLTLSTICFSLSGLIGLRASRAAKNTASAPRTRSRIATQVFGCELPGGAAATSSSTNAATTPTSSVAPKAPSQNQVPVRIGRSPSTSASTEKVSVVGDSIAAIAVRNSSTSAEPI